MKILFFREDAPREGEISRLWEVFGDDAEVAWFRPLREGEKPLAGDPNVYAEDSQRNPSGSVRRLVEYMRERGFEEVIIDERAVRMAETLCLFGVNPLWARTEGGEGGGGFGIHRIKSVTIEEEHLNASSEEVGREEEGGKILDTLCDGLVNGDFSSGEIERALRAVRRLLRLPPY